MSLHLGIGGQGVVDGDDFEDFLNLLGIVLVARVLAIGIAVEQFGYGQFADVAVATLINCIRSAICKQVCMDSLTRNFLLRLQEVGKFHLLSSAFR